MPSTFTARYGFEKPPIGITTGWGASHNTDLDSMDALFGTLEDGLADVVVDLGNKSDVGHTHPQSEVTNLVSDLAAINSSLSGKAALSHSHAQSDVTGLVTALAGKSDTGHSHVESDVTGLVSDLAAINSSLALKAPSASPALTGNPTAPTQSPGNNSTRIATTAYADAAVAALVNSSPAALDTLAELATALGNDANFAATVTTALGTKQATSEKDQNSGYAGLTAGGLLKSAQFPTPTTSAFGGVKDLAAVATKFLTSIVNGIPIAAQPAATDVSGLAAIATSGKWSDLQNATAALTLANAGNATTFNHTSAVDWTWANTTAATSTTTASSPSLILAGHDFYNAADDIARWTIQNNIATPVTGAVTNAVETAGSVVTLTITGHSFQAGFYVTFQNLTTYTWLNGQTARISSTTANTIIFTDPTSHGTQGSTAITGTAIQVPDKNLTFTLSQSAAGGPPNGKIILPAGGPGGSSTVSPSIGWSGGGPFDGFFCPTGGTYGLGIGVPVGSGTAFLHVYQAPSQGTPLQVLIGSTGNNSAGNQTVDFRTVQLSTGISLQGSTTTGTSNPAVLLGNAANNFTATSGAQIGVGIGYSRGATTSLVFAPASGTATFQATIVKYSVNQTGGANGAVTGLTINAVETAVGGTHLLLDLQAGASGGTSVFAINNSGVCTKYKGIATVGDGSPYEVGTADLTGQTAAKTTTTLYTPTATGWYRISVYLKVTTPATTGSATSTLGGTTGVTITFTDGTDSVAQTQIMALMKQDGSVGINNNGNTTATKLIGTIAIYAKTGVAIQYAIDYLSNTAAQMQYEARLRCEAM
jgi:hypothetical protein